MPSALCALLSALSSLPSAQKKSPDPKTESGDSEEEGKRRKKTTFYKSSRSFFPGPVQHPCCNVVFDYIYPLAREFVPSTGKFFLAILFTAGYIKICAMITMLNESRRDKMI